MSKTAYNTTLNTMNVTAGGGSGSSGVYLTTNGTSGSAWSTPVYTTSTAIMGAGSLQNSLQVQGDAHFSGDVTVKGKNLVELLETIESRLAMLAPNPKLEAEFDELRSLGDAYRAAEKKLLEQKRVWEILKKED